MIYRNIVTYRVGQEADAPRVVLQLTSPWVRTVGLDPDYNAVVVTAAELAKLGGDYSRPGTVEFWFHSPPPASQPGGDPQQEPTVPDVALAQIRVVDIKPRLTRGGAENPQQLVEYILVLADKRDGWLPPRGGLLRRGLVNPSTTSLPDGSIGSTYLTSALVRICLESLGEGDAAIAAIDDTPPPVNLRWERAWAINELKPLLDRANASVAVRADGSVAVVRLGQGDAPQTAPDRTLPETRLSGISGRGSAVVVCSAPSGSRLTLCSPATDRGVSWRYVVPRVGDNGRQQDGEFVELEASDEEIAAIPSSEADPKKRLLLDSAFKFVEIVFNGAAGGEGGSAAAAGLAPGTAVLPWCYEDVGLITTPLAVGLIPVNVGGGVLSVLESRQRIQAAKLHTSAGRYVLEFDTRIMRFREGVTTCPASEWQKHFRRMDSFTAVDGSDGHFRITVEPVYVIDGRPEKQFFVDAFAIAAPAEGGGIATRLDEGAARELLDGSVDRVLLCRPELQRLEVIPEYGASGLASDNLADLQIDAEVIARNFAPTVSGGDEPRVVVVAGFEPVELSGRVISIEIDQAAVSTTIEIDTYHATRPFLAGQVDALKDSGRRATPAEARNNTGAAERPSVSLPAAKPPMESAAAAASEAVLVRIDAPVAGAKGYYRGFLQSGPATIAAAEDINEGHLGSFLGLNPVLVVNLPEVDAATEHAIDTSKLPRTFLCWPVKGTTSTSAVSASVFWTMAYQFAACSPGVN